MLSDEPRHIAAWQPQFRPYSPTCTPSRTASARVWRSRSGPRSSPTSSGEPDHSSARSTAPSVGWPAGVPYPICCPLAQPVATLLAYPGGCSSVAVHPSPRRSHTIARSFSPTIRRPTS